MKETDIRMVEFLIVLELSFAYKKFLHEDIMR